MKMNNKIPKQIHNLLIETSNYKPLFNYQKDGIYIMFGPIKGANLTKSYIENPDGVLEYLENILDSERCSYKLRVNINEVISDLKNNNY
jgi:hypothetical protein